MPVEVSTVYTKERLLDLNRFDIRRKKPFWILMAVCTFIVFIAFLLARTFDEPSPQIDICMLMVIVLDVLYILLLIVIPKIAVKKAKLLDARLQYSFFEDHFEIHAAFEFGEETTTLQYAALTRVDARNGDLYLFISKQQAYIVDLTQMSLEQQYWLRNILQNNLEPKKVKWVI